VAKRGTRSKPKFKRLCRRLNETSRGALGLLEIIWEIAATHARRGDIGRQWSDLDIAEEVGWERDPAELIDALVVEGWLDPCPVHRLVVHDWHEHADGSVIRSLKRETAARLDVKESDVKADAIDWARPTVPIIEAERTEWRQWLTRQTEPRKPARRVRPLSGQRSDTAELSPDKGGPPSPVRSGPVPPGLHEGAAEPAAPELDLGLPERKPKPPWGPMANLLGAHGADGVDAEERATWLERFWPEIEAAAEAEADDDATPKQLAAARKKIALARWRIYVTTNRSIRREIDERREIARMEAFRDAVYSRPPPVIEGEDDEIPLITIGGTS
jgi:hypothetical protein